MASLYERYRDVLRQGHLSAARGQRVEALQAYETAARMLPRRAVPRIGIGRMHLALGDLDAARAAFLLALAIEPDNADALDGVARLDAAPPVGPAVGRHADDRAERPATAPAGAARVSKDDRPMSPFRGVPADPPEVRAIGDRWDTAHAAGDVGGLLDAAVAFARSGRAQAAALAVHDALAIDAQQPRVYEVASELDRRVGRTEQARSLRARLARFVMVTDDPDGLERRLQAAQDAGDVPGIMAVADEHHRRGRPRSATEALSVAVGIAPGDIEVHLAMARLGIRPGVRVPARVVRSVELLARLAELDGDAPGRRRIADFVFTHLATAY